MEVPQEERSRVPRSGSSPPPPSESGDGRPRTTSTSALRSTQRKNPPSFWSFRTRWARRSWSTFRSKVRHAR